jgi:hypothetical protein
MRQGFVKMMVVIFLLAGTVFASIGSPAQAMGVQPQATQAVATVTGTPSGPMAVVVPGPETQINLRSGPNTIYDKVGVLLVGQQVPAKGRSPGGTWVEVEYPGVPGGLAWIFSTYVKIVPPMELPIVEIPPTPTPEVTVTVDPTLAARFIVTTAPTRLPTYTPPPPLSIPTFQAEGSASVGPIPMGFVILGLAVVGVLFGLISLAQGR